MCLYYTSGTDLLDALEVGGVLLRDEVDGQAQMAEAARAPNAMQVRLRGLSGVSYTFVYVGQNCKHIIDEQRRRLIPRGSRSSRPR